MRNVLSDFATTILKDRFESMGYKRVKNSWYKVVPGVILCSELQKLKYHAFRIQFGIVPFSCYCYFRYIFAHFDIQDLHWEKHKLEYIEQFHLPYHPENPHFFWHPDSTTFVLKDPKWFPFYSAYWMNAVDEIMLPALKPIHDLKSACAAIEQICLERKFDQSLQFEQYEYAPAFSKIGNRERAIQCSAALVEKFAKDQEEGYIETEAERAWKKWEKDGTGICSPYLWRWLIQTDDTKRLGELISANERAALDWIKKHKLG